VRRSPSPTWIFAVAGLAVLLVGAWHYVAFRDIDQTWFGALAAAWFDAPLADAAPADSTGGWTGAAPAFLHVVAFVLLTWALTGLTRTTLWLAPALWTLINALFELSQSRVAAAWRMPGTFDANDLVAILFGGAIAFGVGWASLRVGPGPIAPRVGKLRRLIGAGVIVPAGLLTITASYLYGYYLPVYMSYADLRAAVRAEAPRPLTQVGKIYEYQSWLLVNERNRGVHLFDNTDPANPRNHAFIVVPGNLDVAVRDGYLYADSFIDLVTIDLNDPANIREVNRALDVFPYDEYQAVPNFVWFDSVDRARGVVIDYAIEYRDSKPSGSQEN
jgi:hypothetical protein